MIRQQAIDAAVRSHLRRCDVSFKRDLMMFLWSDGRLCQHILPSIRAEYRAIINAGTTVGI